MAVLDEFLQTAQMLAPCRQKPKCLLSASVSPCVFCEDDSHLEPNFTGSTDYTYT